jgi:transposase, IS30 family
MAQQKYSQLSFAERDQLSNLRQQGCSLTTIAKRLKRDKSTISRELRRNRSLIYDAYGGGSAQRRAEERKRQAGRRPRLKHAKIRSYVKRKLRAGWSPEQIAGRLPQEFPGFHISHEAIYQYVYLPATRQAENLVPFLARAHKHRLLKGHRHTHRDPHIPERISILQRPNAVQQRRQLGHWESDTVVARQCKAALHVVVERKTRLTKITRLNGCTARATRSALNRRLSRYPQAARRTITYDNGKENVQHIQVNKVLGTRSFFCEPYHSWEKGTVENTIGLIRRVFPKKTKFDSVSIVHIKKLERQLNNRPRKSLSYKTPNEVFRTSVALAH